MDIFDQLRRDHETVIGLIEALGERRHDDLVLRLRTELTAHLAAEELVLYQRMSEDSDATHAIQEGIRRHREARSRMSDVFVARDDGRWPATVAALREIVEEHVRFEEESVFPLARRTLATGEDELLVRRYDEARADYAA